MFTFVNVRSCVDMHMSLYDNSDGTSHGHGDKYDEKSDCTAYWPAFRLAYANFCTVRLRTELPGFTDILSGPAKIRIQIVFLYHK